MKQVYLSKFTLLPSRTAGQKKPAARSDSLIKASNKLLCFLSVSYRPCKSAVCSVSDVNCVPAVKLSRCCWAGTNTSHWFDSFLNEYEKQLSVKLPWAAAVDFNICLGADVYVREPSNRLRFLKVLELLKIKAHCHWHVIIYVIINCCSCSYWRFNSFSTSLDPQKRHDVSDRSWSDL